MRSSPPPARLHPARAAALLAAVLLLPAASPPPAVPIYREFGRFLLACDNIRSCVVRGFDEVTRAELDVTRDAGDAPAALSLSAADPFQPANLRLDGQPLPFPAPAWTADTGVLSTTDPAAIAAFLAAVRPAHTLTLDPAPTRSDEDPRTIPLDGLTAALLLMDAVQGRPGTPSALIAPTGPATAPAAPALPPPPTWIRPPPLTRAEQRRLLPEAGRLPSPAFETCEVKTPPTLFALDATTALAIRPCYMAAYQGSSVVAILPRAGGAARPLTLALPGLPRTDAGPATDGPDMVDPEFDPATGTLVTVSRGRGIADCGSNEAWVWSAGAFRIASLEYQAQCGGTDPGDWPTLYRTRPKPPGRPRR